MIIQSDASKKGWVTVFEGSEIGGWRSWRRWTPCESSRHKPARVTSGALFALQSFGAHVKKAHIQLQLDNATTVVYIDNMRGDKCIEADSEAQEVLEWAIKRDNWLTAVHTPGKSNVGAD